MTLPPNRIEAAARARYERDEMVHRGGTPWEKLGYFAKQYRNLEAQLDLAAAYPELANGTAWIAPRSTTEDMLLAGRDALRLPSRDHVSAADHVQKIYCAMRDAFLQEPKDKP